MNDELDNDNHYHANLRVQMMLKSFKAAVLAIAVGLIGCNSANQTTNTNTSVPNATSAASDKDLPEVVATTSILCDLTKEIAGNTIDLTCLVPPGTDPHLYQARPEDRKAIENGQLILYGGYDFEPGLIKLIEATKNPALKIAVHEAAVPKPLQTEEHDHGHGETTSTAQKQEETVPDPHVWHDAQNGIRMVEVISRSLEKVSPNNAAIYTSNAQNLNSELTQVDKWINSQIATIPANQRKLVTTHDALGYYVQAYGLSFEGALDSFSTDERPTAARVREVVNIIKQTQVPTVFAETTTSPQLIEAIAREANVKVSNREIFADGLGEPGTEGDTYKRMLIANTRTIVEGLGGKYTPIDSQQ